MTAGYELELVGHACSILSRDGTPLLATDPWLVGTAYFDAWMLESYPRPDEIERVDAAPWIYVTHEHPDHLSWPSVEVLKGDHLWLMPPYLHSDRGREYQARGLHHHALEPDRWWAIAPEASILCHPLLPSNNDSILLIDTPGTLVVNLNDVGVYVQLSPGVCSSLVRMARCARERGKRVLVLCSHSPACNAFDIHKDGRRLQTRSKEDYVAGVQRTCRWLHADAFACFASNVLFCRPENAWANDFRVTYEDLARGWHCETVLHPPFCTLELGSLEVIDQHSPETGPHAALRAAAAERATRELEFELPHEDWGNLAERLGHLRPLFALLYPRGIGVTVGGERRRFRPVTGRWDDAPRATMEVEFLPLSLHEALESRFLQDLGIAMISPVRLRGRQPAVLGRIFYVALAYLDYGHFESAGRLARWLACAVRGAFTRIPLPPESAPPLPRESSRA